MPDIKEHLSNIKEGIIFGMVIVGVPVLATSSSLELSSLSPIMSETPKVTFLLRIVELYVGAGAVVGAIAGLLKPLYNRVWGAYIGGSLIAGVAYPLFWFTIDAHVKFTAESVLSWVVLTLVTGFAFAYFLYSDRRSNVLS